MPGPRRCAEPMAAPGGGAGRGAARREGRPARAMATGERAGLRGGGREERERAGEGGPGPRGWTSWGAGR